MHAEKIVAIGASAGGLAALEALFRNVPKDLGCAYVVVQHLSPDFKSVMDHILSRLTDMPVHRAEEKMALEENHIYLIPPGKMLTIQKQSLHLENKESGLKFPIDEFFKSMAAAEFKAKIGIVLSGSGTDGTRGVEAIRENGGVILVQNPGSAEFDAMPRSAIDTGVVDAEMDPEEMGPYLEELFAIEQGIGQKDKDLNLFADISLQPFFDLLLKKSDIHFSRYKETTLRRRITRRIKMNTLESAQAYLELLEVDEEELNHLFHDILIGVTEFFRDEEAFESLELELRTKLETHEGEFRCWVAGCASGQEVYSIAILLLEIAEHNGFEDKISVFATDVYAPALEKASSGVYSNSELQAVSPAFRNKYFEMTSPHLFKVGQLLRKSIIFANHNLIQDPPFTNMDLTACRNFLIYLKPEAQEDALYNLRYSLRENGLLFLGKSESTGKLSDQFKPVRPRVKIFRVDDQRPRPKTKLQPSDAGTHQRIPEIPGVLSSAFHRPGPNLIKAYDALLDRFGPDGLILDKNQEIIHYLGNVSRFLLPLKGRTSSQLGDRASSELGLAVTTLFSRFQKQKETETVGSRGILVEKNAAGEPLQLNLQLSLLTQGKTELDTLFILTIEENSKNSASEARAKGKQSTPEPTRFDLHESAQERISELELELQNTRQNLSASIEELETGNEEIQASNEEMTAANEELQSTNEELHSVNEELHTVNSELESKNQELDRLNIDQRNLLNSLEMGIVFVDPDLKIRKFNPAILNFFHFQESDVGRPLKNLAYHLENQGELLDAAAEVIREGSSREGEVQSRSGTWFQRRILPYYNADHAVEGAIICFAEITEIKEMEAQMRRALEVSRMIWWNWDLETDELTIDARDDCMLGYSCGEVARSRQFWMEQVHPDDREMVEKSLDAFLKGKDDLWTVEHRFWTLEETWIWVYQQGEVIDRNDNGDPIRVSGITQDINKRKLDELALLKNERELETLIEQPLLGIGLLDPEGKFIRVNSSLCTLSGFKAKALLGTHYSLITHPNFKEFENTTVRELLQGSRNSAQFEKKIICQGGEELWVLGGWSTVRNDDGKVVDLIHHVVDISDIKKFQERIESLTERYEIAANAANIGVFQWELESGNLFFDRQLLEIYNLPDREKPRFVDYQEWLDAIYPPDREKIEKAMLRCQEQGDNLNERFHVESEDGNLQTLQAFGTFTEFENEEPKEMIGVNQNITDLDVAEERSRELQNQLFQSQKMEMIGTLAGGIAHDFNNILAALVGYVELLGRRESLSSSGKEHLQLMNKSLQRAKNLVAQILTFSRKGEAKQEKLDIFLSVREALEFLKSSFPSFIELEENLSKNVGLVIGDPVHIHQIVVNLCTNAEQSVEAKGNQEGKIKVALERVPLEEELSVYGRILSPGNYARLRVSDNGIGIPEAIISRIFEPFYTTKEIGKGTGLGLSVVRGIIDTLEGGILVNSTEGNGAEITVFIPLLDEETEETSSKKTRRNGNGEFDGSGLRVLFVDDESAITMLGKRLLEDVGFEVESFNKIEEAEASLFNNGSTYDLIITDHTMPSKTGIQFAREIREKELNLPILLISGFGSEITAESLQSIGNIRLVEKPYTSHQLFQELNELLN